MPTSIAIFVIKIKKLGGFSFNEAKNCDNYTKNKDKYENKTTNTIYLFYFDLTLLLIKLIFYPSFNIIFLNRIKWKISIKNKNKKIEINAIYNI